ncbi:hypothetical protein Tco_0896264 [Tanacetum coccineum]
MITTISHILHLALKLNPFYNPNMLNCNWDDVIVISDDVDDDDDDEEDTPTHAHDNQVLMLGRKMIYYIV